MTDLPSSPFDQAEFLERPHVSNLDAWLGKAWPVLDKGHIRVIDYMGNDEAIVQAARVSYGKGTKKVHEDRGLIRYLMRNRHSTPFEMCELKIHIRIPMDAWRQMIRHRTANVNEYSTRYSVAIDDKQETRPDEWRLQSKKNKQGSGDFLPVEEGEELTKFERDFHELSWDVYQKRLDKGVAKEQARKDLPLSTYTEAYWKMDLHNLFHYLSLRMDSHAQKEIRDFATVIGEEIVSRWCPIAWEAFQDYRLGAMFLTRLDIEVLQAIQRGNESGVWEEAQDLADKFGWLALREDKTLKPNRERSEFEAKAARLGIRPPWL